jgi:hypothetical protein
VRTAKLDALKKQGVTMGWGCGEGERISSNALENKGIALEGGRRKEDGNGGRWCVFVLRVRALAVGIRRTDVDVVLRK